MHISARAGTTELNLYYFEGAPNWRHAATAGTLALLILPVLLIAMLRGVLHRPSSCLAVAWISVRMIVCHLMAFPLGLIGQFYFTGKEPYSDNSHFSP